MALPPMPAYVLSAILVWGIATCYGCSSGKEPTHICTDLICHDEFAISVNIDDTGAPRGAHVVNVTADGASSSCSFNFPPNAGDPPGAMCSAGVTLVVQSVSGCQTVATDATLGERCDAAVGQYNELILVKGTPQSIRIQQTSNGTILLDKTATPSYHVNQPNGPNCPPSCQQAAVQWTI